MIQFQNQKDIEVANSRTVSSHRSFRSLSKTNFNFNSQEKPSTSSQPSTILGKTLENASPLLVISMMISALCNNSAITIDENGEWKATGDPTEVSGKTLSFAFL